MANETVTDAINVHVEERDNISAVDDGAELVSAAARKLPLLAVKDLLTAGVCTHCIFRLFGVMECLCTNSMLSVQVFSDAVKRVVDAEVAMVNNTTKQDSSSLHCFEESELVTNFCRICLGILQFSYQDEKGMSLNKVCAKDLAVSIVESVKKNGHTVDGFSLEVSIPAIIVENEQSIWSYIQLKHSSDPWFLRNSAAKRISVKDVLKLSITDSLENLLGTKCSNNSPFHIRLTYTNGVPSANIQSTAEKTEANKRRKTGTEDRGLANGTVAPTKEYSDLLTNVSKPCYLSVSCARNPIYIGGRYFKYSRNVSQTRWVIDDERMGEASVEEIIGNNILPICGGDNYKFHAAGREDIDVRMLGSGRPFLVEIQNARHVPSVASIKAIEEKINSLESKLVGVKNVKELGIQGWDLMREGESEKQKQYAALVWISRPLEDDDLKNISSFKDLSVVQKTPIRVLHRRSPLERPKIIHWMKIERIGGSPNYFLFHLCTQAGTYIKEFVHGDLGRTHPSVGSILGCRAEILQLDVTDVKMDFLNE